MYVQTASFRDIKYNLQQASWLILGYDCLGSALQLDLAPRYMVLEALSRQFRGEDRSATGRSPSHVHVQCTLPYDRSSHP